LLGYGVVDELLGHLNIAFEVVQDFSINFFPILVDSDSLSYTAYLSGF